MPSPQLIAEVVGQLVMEAGAGVIQHRFGWKGCVVAIVIVVGIIALAWWYFLR
jgi:hypothetical protein